jgi:hypothetical protein
MEELAFQTFNSAPVTLLALTIQPDPSVLNVQPTSKFHQAEKNAGAILPIAKHLLPWTEPVVFATAVSLSHGTPEHVSQAFHTALSISRVAQSQRSSCVNSVPQLMHCQMTTELAILSVILDTLSAQLLVFVSPSHVVATPQTIAETASP